MNTQGDLLEGSSGDGLAARRVALRALDKILGQKKMLDTVLAEEGNFSELPGRDRPFVRMMVATVLRRKGQLDDLILRASDKGEAPRPEVLRWIMYLGITQILFMDVANHAAVDTSVNLAAEAGLEGKKGYVNAILRRMTKEGNAWLDAQDAAALNVPAWLYQQWVASYGVVRAKDIAMALLNQAPLDITTRKNIAPETLVRLNAEPLPTGSFRRGEGGAIEELAGFESGEWWIQDAASALPVRLFGDLTGKTVLDMCAAPGGKTMQLADAGAKVVALDRNAKRMLTLRENITRTNFTDKVECIIEDGAVWKPRAKFTHILLDAPCTATGTARRHPDLLALKSEKDQNALVATQERLLQNAAEILEVGGTLIYCTCSLQKAEGEHQVEKFLNTHRNFKRIPVRREEFGGMDGFVNSEGDVRVLPYLLKEQGGMDGFFISRMEKNG